MKGKVAIITGSTQGLGEGIARKFILEGLEGLIICGRNTIKGRRLETEFTANGCRTIYVEADFAKHDEVLRVLEVAKTSFPEIHILVNSAGITDRATLLDTTEDFYDRMFNINFKAPFFLMQGVSRLMLDKNIHGSILNILSMSSYGGQPFLAAYCSSKSALLTLTKNSAFALMKNHIRVNGINLGWTDTPGEDRIQHEYHNAGDNWLKKIEEEQPFGRLIKPSDIGELAYFILSDKSGLMTGSIIDYDQSVIGANYLPPRP